MAAHRSKTIEVHRRDEVVLDLLADGVVEVAAAEVEAAAGVDLDHQHSEGDLDHLEDAEEVDQGAEAIVPECPEADRRVV